MSSTTWKVLGTGAPVVAAILARKALTSGWQRATGNEPPSNPADPETDWREAVLWGALTGAVIGLARMAASRQAARLAQKASGELPDDVRRDTTA
ncbi:DUF4235 domain-containing protein [Salsipaludibacter albus]|uniref:DUF4235 domain-containing protein n=1 Tax=Salsipaludibacter albus TaxID=2849650 RepID=UPI001EE3CA21|nr:DUF4235 domain-containing protein [Salsipaludibacter albus]MBY5162554.1 DUF4235 domain-containing protein [Salsipaludibacter albus]